MAINQPGVRTNVPTAQAHQQGPIPLPLVATLPQAAQAQQNQQLLAQFPQLMSSLQHAAQGAPTSPVAVVVAPVGNSTGRFEIKVHTSGAGDTSAVSGAVVAYMIQRCGADVFQSTRGAINLNPQASGRAKVDAALQDLNSLGALVQHLGGNAQIFTELLKRPDWAADLEALTDDQPKVALQQVGDKVLVVVNPHADVNSLVAAARLLFAGNGNEQAMSLLCEALLKSEASNSSEVLQQFVAGLSKGHFPADASRAMKALMKVPVTEWFHVSAKDFAASMNNAVQAFYAARCPQGALGLAIRTAHVQGPLMGNKIVLLKIVFDVALQARDTQTARIALDALEELGDDAQAVHAECVEQVKVSNQLATMEWSPHRQALERASFKFEFGFDGALISQSKFDPAMHSDALLAYAAELIDASLDSLFIARFVAPVAEFLIGHFAALPQPGKLELARICANLIDTAHSPGATVHKLQQAIEAELLNSTIVAAKQAGSPMASMNALVWLLAHKDQLFSSLQRTGTDVEKAITAALTELGVPENFEHTIDERAARAALKTALSPSFDILLNLFKNSALACTSPLTQASRQCFTAVNPASFELVQLRHQLDALPLQSEEQWQKLQQAFQEVLDTMQHMVGSAPAQLANVHGSVVDAIVELAEGTAEGPVRAVMSWCGKALEALESDQAMLASVSKADPRAVQWLSMAVISVTLPSKREVERSSMLGEFRTICRGPGATLDRRLDAAIRLLLRTLLDQRDPLLKIVPRLQVSQAVELVALHGSLATREGAWEDASPLPLVCLGLCTEFYKEQLKPSRRPDRNGDNDRGNPDILRGILTELSRHDVQLAQTFLSELAQLHGDGVGPSKGAGLAFTGYVHLANLLHAKNDAKGMLRMLVAALAHLPTDAAERRRVLPEFSDLIKNLRQAGELPDPLTRLMRDKGL